MLKLCSRCHQDKPLTDFFLHKKSGSRRYACKHCTAEMARENRHANPERTKATNLRNAKKDYVRRKDAISEYKRRYYELNIDATKERCNRNYYGNHEENKQSRRNYSAANRALRNASEKARRADKMRAHVVFGNRDFHDLVMKEAYALSILRKRVVGGDWHVDHIVPLKSRIVCGLHAWTNVQVIPALANIVKGNRSWPDMP